MKCRFCNSELKDVFVDLGHAPLSNAFLSSEDQFRIEKSYPLKVFVCSECYLVQTGIEINSEDIFNDGYIYYSSFSKSWLKHAEEYVHKMMLKYSFDDSALVVEIASNDGYLLQYFKNKNIPVLGIEPSGGTAEVAIKKGIDTRIEYFGKKSAENLVRDNIKADLIVGNNVLAHVPDINDFVSGFKTLLKNDGIITFEFPHLLKLVQQKQFDTIYHEHFFYLSLTIVKQILQTHGLEIFDVEELQTHGGSLRIYVKHADNKNHNVTENVSRIIRIESDANISSIEFYRVFQRSVNEIKINILDFLIEKKKQGKKIIAYGAAAKGNTFLNFCGVKNDLIDYVVDASSYKQGKYLPGSHIPVFEESRIKEDKPEYILILPWNIKEEIMNQLSYVKDWGAKFLISIPQLEVI